MRARERKRAAGAVQQWREFVAEAKANNWRPSKLVIVQVGDLAAVLAWIDDVRETASKLGEGLGDRQ